MIAPSNAKDRLKKDLRVGDFIIYMHGGHSHVGTYLGKITEIKSSKIKILALSTDLFLRGYYQHIGTKLVFSENCLLLSEQEIPQNLQMEFLKIENMK